jgi:hypothetical protein
MSRAGRFHLMRHLVAVVGLAVLAACGDQHPTAPPARTAEPTDLLFFPSQPRLIECPSTVTETQTALIGIDGGTISIGGMSVLFPAGALLGPTNVTLTVPASRYVEIDIQTDGPNQFLDELLRPTVTISYARCGFRLDLLFRLVSAWYIDSATKALLEKQISIDNKLTRTVTFRPSHFSGYAIAF